MPSYFNTGNYYPYNNYYNNQQTSTTPNSGRFNQIIVVPVQNLESANAYPVAAGNTVLLMDYTGRKFWLKSTGMDGLTQNMIEHHFAVGVHDPGAHKQEYVSRSEFEDLKKAFEEFIK